jgi:hypothetical protein
MMKWNMRGESLTRLYAFGQWSGIIFPLTQRVVGDLRKVAAYLIGKIKIGDIL